MVNTKMPEHACKRAQIICFGDRNSSSTKVTEYVNVTLKERDREYTNGTATGSTTTPGARARAYRSEFAETLEALGEYYCDTFDRTRVARIVEQDMLGYLQAGMQPEVIILALDDTGRAERPSWQYTLAILKRCQREGILTAEAWERQKEQRSGGRLRGAARNAPKNPALNYSQREYSPDWEPDDLPELCAELQKQNTK